MEKELSWQFIAGNKQENDGRFMEATFVVVTAKNEKEAFKKARKVLKRKIYFLKSVAEIDNKIDKLIDKISAIN